MEFSQETTIKIGELEHLFRFHNEESGTLGLQLDINWGAISFAQLHGLFRSFLIRNHGVPVGYDFFFVSPDILHKTKMAATELAIFIHPAHRGCGPRFIKWVDSRMEADIIYRGTKKGHSLERFGYTKLNDLYGKVK